MNEFENAYKIWKFVEPHDLKLASESDLDGYPSALECYPEYQNEEMYEYEQWKQNYLLTMQRRTQTTSHNNNIYRQNNNKRETKSAPSRLNSLQMLHIPSTAKDILCQTQRYIKSLNELTKTINNTDMNIKYNNNALNYMNNNNNNKLKDTKYLLLSKIPSTEKLLNNIIELENELTSLNNNNINDELINNDEYKNYVDILLDDFDEWHTNNNDKLLSPNIVWKQSSRVEVATELPNELCSAYFTIPKEINKENKNKKNIKNNYKENKNINKLKRQNVKIAKSQHTMENEKNNEKLKMIIEQPSWNYNDTKGIKKINKIKYGEWYLNPKKWKIKNINKINNEMYNNNYNIDNKKLNELKKKIPKLFISKMYKQYILNQKGSKKVNLPKYLENV